MPGSLPEAHPDRLDQKFPTHNTHYWLWSKIWRLTQPAWYWAWAELGERAHILNWIFPIMFCTSDVSKLQFHDWYLFTISILLGLFRIWLFNPISLTQNYIFSALRKHLEILFIEEEKKNIIFILLLLSYLRKSLGNLDFLNWS